MHVTRDGRPRLIHLAHRAPPEQLSSPATLVRWYGPESATPGAFRLNSPSIRSRRRDDVPPLPLIATSPVELLYGYPIDGVVLTTGCDKTTPAGLMAAATVDIPAIVLSGGPMLNGRRNGERIGSGTVIWKARGEQAAGRIDYREFIDIVAASAPSIGHCNTMGTASTMNALAEALGMSLPGCAAIPAPYRERAQIAYETGRRAVEIVHEDLKPSDILTRTAFENAIVACSAIGGSSNAPIHINAIARHVGVSLSIKDWETIGHEVPLLVNMQPAGKYLGEEYYRAGGLPAVLHELMAAGRIHAHARTINGKTVAENVKHAQIKDPDVIRPYGKPLKQHAGLKVLSGNLFDSAIMKTSVISKEFRQRYLSNAKDPNAFEGRAVVFDGPEDYHHRIDDTSLKIDANTMLFIRGVGPIGYPGSAEVVNMQPPAALIKRGITSLPCIGDGRQSGTSASPSIINASPEAAAGGGLALLKTGDRVRIDLNEGSANMLVPDAELAQRRAALEKQAATNIPRVKRRGRRSNAAWSISSPTAWFSSRPSNIIASRKRACRGTTTDLLRRALSRANAVDETWLRVNGGIGPRQALPA